MLCEKSVVASCKDLESAEESLSYNEPLEEEKDSLNNNINNLNDKANKKNHLLLNYGGDFKKNK